MVAPSLRRTRSDAPNLGPWVIWSAELSPFALKLDALCDYAGLTHRWLPAEGGGLEGVRANLRVRRVMNGRLPLTWPEMTELDEFPLVPFLLGPGGENLYDSSAIAEWLDARDTTDSIPAPGLVPGGDAALRLAVRLVDEYFDEFGLYMVHHNRWVVSARDNGAGERLAGEFRRILGPLASPMGRRFSARQVRRLPYLFSVAPPDAGFDDLPARLRPPSRAGFPPTHRLLDDCFHSILDVMERRLADRPYLFGDRFCLADASAYGQLMMNRTDPSADSVIRGRAPRVSAWIDGIATADFAASRTEGALVLDEGIRPLLAEVCRVFVPLMQQNHDAWKREGRPGRKACNESAFDAGRALYDGELCGNSFRSVVKTFQVRVWQSLRAEWNALTAADRIRLEAVLPEEHGLDRDEWRA